MNAPTLICPPMLGQHLLLDMQGVLAAALTDAVHIERVLRDAAHAAGATVVDARLHHFGPGLGVTGVLLLKESHISIHTWPEYGYAAVDIFMCGTAQPALGVDVIVDMLRPVHWQVRDHARGPGFARPAQPV
ncbi:MULTISPECIES: adenosylmethionine decarboxylase [unclassified Cupriavidus]|uniref:adenosylmethionine decarboxylase n=1 Tax=unclassified Cupriavidus TaxID=2640874 RepID=UPI0010F54592|nr:MULTISPECIES: adenosylmethionine decarboxylase [unclassified Cupriavidus]MWL88794.1 adenosylmethionine decarboxylase [Cupriavidus sp. SW-Y-13]